MISIIRKYQKSLMVIVAILTIVAFAWLYNPAEMQELGANVAAVGYGRTFTRADIDRLARLYSLALALGQTDLVSSLTSRARDEDSAMSEFIANLIVLRHESAALGIEPGTAQVAEKVRQIPAFQTRGVFDPGKFEAFANERLGAWGMTTLQIEEVVKDALRLERLREAVAGGVVVSASEMARASRAFQKTDILVLKFPSAAEKDAVVVSDEDIRMFFEQNRQNLTAPESVTLEYVKFRLPEDKVGLEGKERVALLQELAGKASAFAESVAGGAGFAEAAEREGLKVATAGPITRMDTGGLPGPVSQAAFFLREDQTVSEVIQAGDEFYVLRVAARQPERPLELEEAKPKIEERLRLARANQLLQAKAQAAVDKAREALASGQSPAEAAAVTGAEIEAFHGIQPSRPDLPPDLALCGAVAALLEPGKISNPLPAGDGLAAVVVVSRGTDAGPAEELSLLRENLEEADRELVFTSWLSAQREASGLRAARRQ